MTTMSIQQSSFAAGEISPRLLGRTDIQKYASGAALIENFIVRPEGGLVRRHGTRFLGEARSGAGRVRLIPFVFSTQQAYMLEFGDRYMRVWKDDAPVTWPAVAIRGITRSAPARVTAPGHGLAHGDRLVLAGISGMVELNNREFTASNVSPDAFDLAGIDATSLGAWLSGGTVARLFEIASPWREDELDALNFSQSADVLYLVHPAHAPRTLTRTGHTAWTLAAFPLSRGPFAPTNGDDGVRVMCTGVTRYQPGNAVTVRASSPIFQPQHAGSWFRMAEIYLADQSVSPWSPGEAVSLLNGTQVSSNGHVYALVDTGSGTQTGTVPPSHAEGDAWDNPAGAAHRKKWRYLHSRWAIIRLDTWVDARTMRGTIATWLCNGLAPAPRAVTAIAQTAGRCIVTAPGHGFDEGDLVSLEGAGGAIETNGDWKIVNVTADSFDLAGATLQSAYTGGAVVRRFATWLWAHGAFSPARGYPACVALHEQRLVFANTSAQPSGVWASASADYTNFLPGTRDDETIAYNIAANQADPVRWLASGPDLLLGTLSQEFAAFGGGVGDPITPSNTRFVVQAGEGSNGVQPVHTGTETLFVNRSGRRVICLSSDGDMGTYTALDLTELASHVADGVSITRLAWARNPLSLLWALRSDGTLLAMTWRRAQQVYAWSRHSVDGAIESIAVIPSPGFGTDDLWIAVRRNAPEGERRHIEVMAPCFEPHHPADTASMGYLDGALRYQGPPATALAGLHHLEGRQVDIVADGALHPRRNVLGGRIELVRPARNVWAGIAYRSRLQSLPLDPGAMLPAAGGPRRIARLAVRVMNAMGGRAGPAGGSRLEVLVPRDLADPMDAAPPLRSGRISITVPGDFEAAPAIEIRQDDPLPLDILSLVAEMSVPGS